MSQGTSSDAATHQVDEEDNVVAKTAMLLTEQLYAMICLPKPKASGFWKRMGSRKTVPEKLGYKKSKGKASC